MSTEKSIKNKGSGIFGCILAKALQFSKMNQSQLAKKSGLRYASINDYINDKALPTFDNVLKISEALGLTLAEFFALSEKNLNNDLMLPSKKINKDREMELLTQIAEYGELLKKYLKDKEDWEIKLKKLERDLDDAKKESLSPPTVTDAMGTAFGAGTQDGLNTTGLNSTDK